KGSAKGYYGGYGLKFEYKGNPAGGTDTFYRDFRGPEFAGTDRPWLLSSGIRGSLHWDIPLIDGAKGQKPALYTVRLGLTSAGADRSVTVKLRGATESQQKVVVPAASIKSPAIMEFAHVQVTDTLALEVGKPLPAGTTAPPAVHFLEVIRERDPPGGARQ
ncbi:MAG: hypothetical protein HN380_30255, partial [Victivallales bacterium]|nr:hypothetical protein [Victivallales bacterium]